MNKQKAQAEILRRLVIYYKSINDVIPHTSAQILLGAVKNNPKRNEELLNMITQDKDGNVLSAPDRNEFMYILDGYYHKNNHDLEWNFAKNQYQQARKEAEQLIEDYGQQR